MEKAANEVLAILETHGFSAYKVGGFVRDTLLGIPVQDIDIATSARPEQVMALFSKVIPTGIQHGTVTVLWKGHGFEVTTYRQEKEYVNHRHPQEVIFVDSIEGDLGRRDYTINAMAMDRIGNLIDPYGGKKDLEEGILRAVGDPLQRFDEDALRILRGLRFCIRFSLTIETNTWKAMKEASCSLLQISKERVRDEISKMIEGKAPAQAVDLLSMDGLLPFPDWREKFTRLSQYVGKNWLNRCSSPVLRWAALLYGDSEEEVRTFLLQWRFSNKFSQVVRAYLHIAEKDNLGEREAKELLLTYGLEKVQQGRHLLYLHDLLPDVKEPWETWDAQLFIRDSRELALTGADLASEIKKQPGPWIKESLQLLFERVAIEGFPNDRGLLIKEARKINGDHEG